MPANLMQFARNTGWARFHVANKTMELMANASEMSFEAEIKLEYQIQDSNIF
jgi:hypothetical protein